MRAAGPQQQRNAAQGRGGAAGLLASGGRDKGFEPRSHHAATLVQHDSGFTIYVVGGTHGECALDEGLEYESAQFGLVFSTDDAREGMQAFLERRKPAFGNR